MEKPAQSKEWAVEDQNMQEVEQPVVGLYEAMEVVQQFAKNAIYRLVGANYGSKIREEEVRITVRIREVIKDLEEALMNDMLHLATTQSNWKRAMLLSGADFDEKKAMRKKLKLDADDDPLKLNVATQGPTATIDDSNHLGTGWTLFRLLIPPGCDEPSIKNILMEEKTEFDILDVAGVNVVMIWSKGDPRSSTSPAVEGFVRIHGHLSDKLVYQNLGLTRLLVPPEQAKHLIYSNLLGETIRYCDVLFYLTDIISVLSDGHVMIELKGWPEHVHGAVCEIASFLKQIPVEESMISESKSQKGITSATGDSAGKFSKHQSLEARREFEFQHHYRMVLACVDHIIGEKGENVKKLQESVPASIIIVPLPPSTEVGLWIHGDSDKEVEYAEKLLKVRIAKEGLPDLTPGIGGCYLISEY